MPETTGLNTTSPEVISETAELAIRHGFQLCVHAIGDRGNRETLDIYQRAFEANPDKIDLRWRIEHSQHIHPDDIPRFGELGVIASMQGIHCTSDGPWVMPRLGEKRAREGAYPWRTLLETDAVVTNGTDAPLVPCIRTCLQYASPHDHCPNGKQRQVEAELATRSPLPNLARILFGRKAGRAGRQEGQETA